MNFSDFCDNNCAEKMSGDFDKNSKNTAKTSKITQKNGQSKQNFENFYTDEQKRNIESKLNKYQNMSESELMSELIHETNKQKQNGSLDSKKLDEIKNTILPVLNPEQANRLESLIKMLK